MLTLTADADSFAASKRTVLDEAEDRLASVVSRALVDYGQLRWYEPILDLAENLYDDTYEQEFGSAPSATARTGLRKGLTTMLAKTKAPTGRTADRIRAGVASYVVNSAFTQAALDDDQDLDMEWVSMEDSHVRPTHEAAHGQVRAIGVKFAVGDSEMTGPGDPTAPPEEWMGCRCLVRPVKAEVPALVAAGGQEAHNTSTVIVGLPSKNDPVHDLGPEQAHMTMLFLGDSEDITDEDLAAINGKLMAMTDIVQTRPPTLTVPVKERGVLGDDGAQVLHLDVPHDWQTTRNELLNEPAIKAAYDRTEQYPQWLPHLTLGYPGQGEISDVDPEHIHFAGLGLWHADDQREYPYVGDDVTAPETDTEPPIADTEPAPADATPEDLAIDPIPWHGTIVVEGAPSGDRRQFAKGSLRNRQLPLPLTYQKTSAEGHMQSVVVGKILGLSRIEGEGDAPNLINAYGLFLDSPEADEAIGMAADFGRWGVSIDADDATMVVVEAAKGSTKGPSVNFTDARIAAACLVTIPAFAEATIQLGSMPAGFMGDTIDSEVDPEVELDPATPGLTAAGATVEMKRGPGWVTDPVATRRIHNYWTDPNQPGYAKIGWGQGGDFNRCRVEVGKYLAESGDARFINATCAQWHFDALGYWPSTHAKAIDGAHNLDDYRGSIAIVAAGGPGEWTPPASAFAPLELDRVTSTTFVEHEWGTEVYGHLAQWDSCHTGMAGVCVVAPRNSTNYRLFHNAGGGVMTDKGLIRTGVLTVGGGHASTKLGVRAAMAHYDSTSTAIVDCRVGEDQFGIWFHGWLRPSATPEQRHAFRASKLSGDWRWFDGEQELMLACAVNLAGFPSVGTTYHNGEPIGLVAAGVLPDEIESSAFTAAQLSDAIAAGIRAYEDGKAAQVVADDLRTRHQARHQAEIAQRAAAIRDRHEGRNH